MIRHNPISIAHRRGIVQISIHIRDIDSAIGVQNLVRDSGRHAVGPQIVDIPIAHRLGGLRAAIVDENVRRRRVHVVLAGGGVDKDDDPVAVGEVAGVHLNLADAVGVLVGDEVAPAAFDRGAEGVLRDGEDGRVGEDTVGGGVHARDIITHDEGGFHGGPHGHVELVFVVGHAALGVDGQYGMTGCSMEVELTLPTSRESRSFHAPGWDFWMK